MRYLPNKMKVPCITIRYLPEKIMFRAFSSLISLSFSFSIDSKIISSAHEAGDVHASDVRSGDTHVHDAETPDVRAPVARIREAISGATRTPVSGLSRLRPVLLAMRPEIIMLFSIFLLSCYYCLDNPVVISYLILVYKYNDKYWIIQIFRSENAINFGFFASITLVGEPSRLASKNRLKKK